MIFDINLQKRFSDELFSDQLVVPDGIKSGKSAYDLLRRNVQDRVPESVPSYISFAGIRVIEDKSVPANVIEIWSQGNLVKRFEINDLVIDPHS